MMLRGQLLVAALAPLSTALLVAPNSNCAVSCGNDLTGLSSTDLACGDSTYAATVAGQTFQSCLNCELNSTYVDPQTNQTDFQWALYNMRYSVSYCLFGYPNHTNVADSPCLTSFACQQIQNATENYLNTDGELPYGFCDEWISDRIPKCQACLQQSGNENYINNYIGILQGACQYKPAAGKILPIQGSVFSATQVNVSDPSIPTSMPTWTSAQSKINLGARVGIAVGAIVLIVVVGGCCVVWRGKRRRRAYLARHAPPTLQTDMSRFHDNGTSPVGSSPQNESAKGLMSHRPWAESPASSTGGYWGHGHPAEKTFSPYSSQYTSPVSPEDNKKRMGDWPMPVARTNDEIEMSQLGKEERDHIEQQRWNTKAQTGFSTDNAPVIRAPQPVRGTTGMNNAF